MGKNDMRLVVSDEPMDLVLLALAAAHKVRTDVIGNLIRDGHVRVIEPNYPAAIRLTVEGEIFSDRRDEFPSVGLVARVQLAVNAGRSERNVPLKPEQFAIFNRWHPTPPWSEALEVGYHNAAQITATVKRERGLEKT